MNKITMTILLFLTAIGYSASGQVNFNDVVGKYQYIHDDFDSAYLDIKQDSTFTYYWRWKQLSGTTTGKWIINKKYLFLNSDIQPPIKSDKIKDKFNVKATNDSLSDKITILFKDVNGDTIKFVNYWVIAKGKSYFNTSYSNGILTFDIKLVESISVRVAFAQTGDITYKDKYKHNNFEITLLNVNQKYLYLTNEKLFLNMIEDQLYLHEPFGDIRVTNIFKKIK